MFDFFLFSKTIQDAKNKEDCSDQKVTLPIVWSLLGAMHFYERGLSK